MKSLITSLILFLSAVSGFPEEVLRETSWTTLQAEGRISGGTVGPPGGDERVARLKVENHEGQQVTVTVLTLTQPPITRARYAITGSVRYEGVQGTAFLEMWSVFPDGGRYFSRTLATEEPPGVVRMASRRAPVLQPGGRTPSHDADRERHLARTGDGAPETSPSRAVQARGRPARHARTVVGRADGRTGGRLARWSPRLSWRRDRLALVNGTGP